MAEAAERFDRAGVQPSERLPSLSLVDLEGQRADLDALRNGKPMVLVTCSLTCNVARRRQSEVAQLRANLGDRALVVMVYTVDAHPAEDASPYTGTLWVPEANARDAVLVRQPATLAARCELARRYAQDWAQGVPMLVDTIDNASWLALGRAPNLGLVVNRDGVVVARTGWCDSTKLGTAIAEL